MTLYRSKLKPAGGESSILCNEGIIQNKMTRSILKNSRVRSTWY